MSENTDSDESYYLLLKDLEESIRGFIEKELSNLNPKWWKQHIPNDVKQNAEERKHRDELRKNWKYQCQPLISYIDFTDYEKIITQKTNWENIFRNIFHDKNAISVKLKEIEPIRNTISHSRNLDSDEIIQLRFYSQEILRGISYYYDSKEETPEKQIPELVMDIPQISVSFDRPVYPVNSTIHLRANVPKVIPEVPIIFKVFNSQEKLLVTKEIVPSEYQDHSLKSAGIYETSFIMTGDDWKVGEEYALKGKHSTAEAASQMRIDTREPVVQSDKSVYHWDSDMILTVIDPDGDRDNDLVEFVGDREDVKLIIKSSQGTLENFRLRETGDSTGIFQGIIGFIGVNDDGTKEYHKSKDNSIETAQDHEMCSEFIEVSENEELEITYSNATTTVKLIVFVSKDHNSP